MAISWESNSQQFEEIEYRYPIYHSSTMTRINSFDEMYKKAKRGTFICKECFNITGDIEKSAVMLKGGVSSKVCLHASHYANKSCATPDGPVHNTIKRAYAMALLGDCEGKYPNSNFTYDARAGNAYYEFELTSLMSPAKQEFMKKFVMEAKGVVYTLNISGKKFKELLPTLWDSWVESSGTDDNEWAYQWYDKTAHLLKVYSPRDYVGKKPGTAKLAPNGSVDVSHSDLMFCNMECKYFHGSQDLGNQMSFFSHCDLAKAHNVPIINSRCIFGMEKQKDE